MFGVFVNVITVIIGSCIGLLFKKGIPEKVSHAAMTGLGACTLFIGIKGSLCGENVLILIASVVLGVITGTLLDIDGSINRLAKKGGSQIPKRAAEGFSGGRACNGYAFILRRVDDCNRFHSGGPYG